MPVGFQREKNDERILVDSNGKFCVSITLKMLLGFFEDYKKIILNMKQELVLIRASNDLDGVLFIDDVEPKTTAVEIPKITFD